MYSASSTMILLCRSSQSENSFGLAVFFFTACFRCKASFLKDSKAASISSKRSEGKLEVFFALLILFRQFWHSFLYGDIHQEQSSHLEKVCLLSMGKPLIFRIYCENGRT